MTVSISGIWVLTADISCIRSKPVILYQAINSQETYRIISVARDLRALQYMHGVSCEITAVQIGRIPACSSTSKPPR